MSTARLATHSSQDIYRSSLDVCHVMDRAHVATAVVLQPHPMFSKQERAVPATTKQTNTEATASLPDQGFVRTSQQLGQHKTTNSQRLPGHHYSVLRSCGTLTSECGQNAYLPVPKGNIGPTTPWPLHLTDQRWQDEPGTLIRRHWLHLQPSQPSELATHLLESESTAWGKATWSCKPAASPDTYIPQDAPDIVHWTNKPIPPP